MKSTMKTPAANEPLLQIDNLSITFTRDGQTIPAVKNADLLVMPGEVLAIVGESGSGKSTLAMTILGLLAGNGEITSGSIHFDGTDMLSLSAKEWLSIRGSKVGLVPQDPMSNLNPMKRVGEQLGEVLLRHNKATRKTVNQECCRLLERAGISDPEIRLKQYPHQLSGGLRQRVLIAIGTACDPKLLIADEPTSALDVTVAARILDQLSEISHEVGMSVVLITHDLGLAAERADHVVVMRDGRIVESGKAAEILNNPQEPYTQQLVEADPGVRARRGKTISRTKVLTFEDQLVEIDGLTKVYQQRKRDIPLYANKNISMRVPRGSTVALVGESGSGKTTVSRMLLKLENPTSGSLNFDGLDINNLDRKQLASFRKRVQPIFQDPYSSLNPMMTVKSIVREGLDHYRIGTKREREAKVKELLHEVGLAPELASRSPSELSGGERQRVAIARAISMKPEMLICDEPVSALDVLVQKQVLDLLSELQEENQLTYLIITHDLSVVREFADYVYVMRNGEIIEAAETKKLFTSPQQMYTKELLGAAGIKEHQ